MRFYVNNNPAKVHPDPIWNDGVLKEHRPNNKKKSKNNKNKMSSDMGSVFDPKYACWL